MATLPLARVLFSVWGMLFWFAFVGGSAVLAFVHWPELTRNLVDRVLAGENLLVLLVTFPLVKLLHEFGHAYAARIHGGEVHEVGIMFLILMPIPYVDATSSSAFASRYKRALVGSAGMLTELFVAAVALHVWLGVQSGMVSAIAYNTMVIAGVSTLLFNANPLIRFDGYYILSDLVEIPNPGTRSTRYRVTCSRDTCSESRTRSRPPGLPASAAGSSATASPRSSTGCSSSRSSYCCWRRITSSSASCSQSGHFCRWRSCPSGGRSSSS
ncbi:MAG: hypothetical protein M5U09_14805 [Gammaproteobacteria bacterium]|nr:hypothetical protein [Gammaproteobacteria bacterium]